MERDRPGLMTQVTLRNAIPADMTSRDHDGKIDFEVTARFPGFSPMTMGNHGKAHNFEFRLAISVLQPACASDMRARVLPLMGGADFNARFVKRVSGAVWNRVCPASSSTGIDLPQGPPWLFMTGQSRRAGFHRTGRLGGPQFVWFNSARFP
jgi:hypothetical protein